MKTKLLLIFLILICGTLALEGVTRLFLLSKTKPFVVPPEIGQFDQTLGWSLKPNSKATSNRTGVEIEYKINSKGLRDDETTYEKPEGVFRIVVLGDSRTFGFGVPIEKHFTTKLEGYYNNVEVINMGVSGYGVDQELLFLQIEGLRYQPDLVIAYVAHYKDHRHMHTERWGKQKPRFMLVNNELILTNTLHPKETAGIVQRIHRWIRSHSVVYDIFYSSYKGLVSDPKHYYTQVGQTEQDLKNLEDESFRKELFELGEAIIAGMNEVCKNHESIFVLVTQIDELHEACLKRNILSLDVSRSLSNKKFALPEELSHINEAGNAVLAWEIAKFLEANNLIPKEHFVSKKSTY